MIRPCHAHAGPMNSQKIGISPPKKAIQKHLTNLKAAGLLRRIGTDKGGHRKVKT